ncbi:MAG: class I SAM-dependent methyltransferase [Deltaproteobacteria bacterium]|nr:class I SAM-dependent methyltransferase [Deltaproteobacteria bacterium]
MSAPRRLDALLAEAVAFRGDQLVAPDACVRVVAGAGDGLPGLVVDRFGGLLVASDYDPAGPGAAVLPVLEAAFPDCAVLVRARRTAGAGAAGAGAAGAASAGPTLHWGRRPMPESLVASEDGLRFEIRSDPRHDFGLFLDGRAARARVRAVAADALVLNLFAYTCGFGVAARAAGARDVVNVDPDKGYLTWGRRNAALNGVDFRVVPDTAQVFLRRWRRRHQRAAAEHFDLVVIDPPAFGVGRGDDRVLRKLWPELLEFVALAAPAHAVIMCNDKAYFGHAAFEATVADALGAYQVTAIPHGPEILGRDPSRTDPWYAPPRVVHATRR